MKYFSLFSGIGGFEHGIHRSLETQKKRIWEKNTLSIRETRNTSNNEGDTRLDDSAPELQQHNIRGSNRQFTCVGFSEIDKYAIQIYKKHFPNHKEYGNVSNITWSDVEDFDLLCGGFPCQSFSIAGKRGGFSDTRGTLFFEIVRVAQEKQPRLLFLENVKGLLSHDKGRTFGTILNTLDELGYDLQWQVLNSKNFGVPQNRERVFIIGHLRGTSRPKVFPIFGESRAIKKKVEQPIIHNMQPRYKTRPSLKYSSGGSGHLQRNNGIVYCLDTTQQTLEKDCRIRRLTPTECERLQGFPDGWTEGISDTQRYKCLGNAVTTNVITAIAEKIIESTTKTP